MGTFNGKPYGPVMDALMPPLHDGLPGHILLLPGGITGSRAV